MIGPLAASALGGALFCLGYVGFGIWPLALVAWAPFLGALEALRGRGAGAALLAGFAFGFVAHAGGFAWLWRLVEVFLGGRLGVGAALWLGHAIWFSAAYAAQALLYRAARARGAPIALAGPASLVAVEALWPHLFAPRLGDAFVDRTHFVQIADLGGALAVSALAALVNAALLETFRWRRGARPRPLATWLATGALLAASGAYGAWRIAALGHAEETAPALRVGLVQANADVLEKRRDPERLHELHLEQSRELLASGPLDLLVWPETVYTRGISGPLPVSGDPIRRDLDVPLLFGAASLRPGEDGRRLRFNSALLVGPDGVIRDGYDKNLLVPFAERLPGFATGRLGEALRRALPHVQEFGASDAKPALALGAFRIATPICYEAAVPGFVRGMMREARPNLVVMLANDAWFGDSHEPWLHLAVARMRAIEHRRWVVRATNSGVSALVDPAGRVVARTPLLERANLRGTVYALEGETFHARAGDWIGWVALAVCVAAALAPRRR